MLCPVVFMDGLAGAERDARAAHRGLWADKAPVAPWEWRDGEKGRKGEAAGDAVEPYPIYPIRLQRLWAIGYFCKVDSALRTAIFSV